MKCENCGATMQVTEHTKFCPFCGEKIVIPKSELEHEIDFAKYAMQHEEAVRQGKEKSSNKKLILSILLLMLIGALSIGAVYLVSEEVRADRLIKEVQQLIIQGDYDTAEVKVEGIRVDSQGSTADSYEKYESIRNELKNLIEQKKKESGK